MVLREGRYVLRPFDERDASALFKFGAGKRLALGIVLDHRSGGGQSFAFVLRRILSAKRHILRAVLGRILGPNQLVRVNHLEILDRLTAVQRAADNDVASRVVLNRDLEFNRNPVDLANQLVAVAQVNRFAPHLRVLVVADDGTLESPVVLAPLAVGLRHRLFFLGAHLERLDFL